jgi:hypothetical protein
MRPARRALFNILHGIGTALDLWPAPLPPLRDRKPRLTTWEALCRDGAKVGGDLWAALRKLAAEAPGAAERDER